MARWQVLADAVHTLGRSLRSLKSDLKAGCPARRDPEDRRRWQIDVQTFADWREERKNGRMPCRVASDSIEPTAQAAKAAIAAVAAVLKDGNPDTLLRMADDLSGQEKVAVEMVRVASGDPYVTPAGLRAYHQIWTDLVQARRQLEKELPEILAKKRRYVDRERVRDILTRAGTSMGMHLDQIGASVATQCEGRSAATIRTIVDDAVRGARRHIVEALRALMEDSDAD